MSEYQVADLQSINKGAVAELFEVEFRKLLQNVQDVNTDPKATRKLTIEIKVKPTVERDRATTTVAVKASLAPIKEHEHFVLFSNRTGRLEALTTDPHEQDLPFGGNVREFTGGTT